MGNKPHSNQYSKPLMNVSKKTENINDKPEIESNLIYK
jgi:hypothetical protein